MDRTRNTAPGSPNAKRLGLALCFLCASCDRDSTRRAGASAISNANTQRNSGPGSAPSRALKRLQLPHHPVFSLYDNRILAHVLRDGGLVVLAGHPGAAKYVSFRRPWLPWKLNVLFDSRRVALATRSVSWFEVPTFALRRHSRLSVSLRVFSPVEQGVHIEVDGLRAKPIVRLRRGWQQVERQVDRAVRGASNSRITFRWARTGSIRGQKAFAAVEWVHVQPTGKTRQPLDQVRHFELHRNRRLWLPHGGGLAFYIHPYSKAKLRIFAQLNSTKQPCDVVATIDGKPQRLIKASDWGQSASAQTFLDLDPVANRVSRLSLHAAGKNCHGVSLDQATIAMPGPAAKRREGPAPKNVLFWLIDNARSDRYRPYNSGTRVETPTIDRLARTGTVFARAYISGTESRVSHASLWTGAYPRQHNFIRPKAVLSKRWLTLPEAVRQGGLYNVAWVANGWISKRWGFADGWDAFHNTLHDGGGLTGEALADHAITAIERSHQRRFFLYVGTIDPHVSWRGRQPWLDNYYPQPYTGRFKKNAMGSTVERIAAGKLQISDRDKERIIAIYDSTISYNDQQLGRVLRALEDKGIRDQTMVVVTADHGEELWEFGRVGHGHSLRHNLVSVPLIIHYPPLLGAGIRVTEGVDALSVMPTILDALGLPIPNGVQGESLIPLANGIGRYYPRPSLATQYELAHTIRLEEYKLWVGSNGKPHLYDLASSAGERLDIVDSRPTVTQWLSDVLGTFIVYQDRWRSTRWGVASNHKPALANDLEGHAPVPPVAAR